ncbi:saccharopine dehydrogenase-like oxidoreductase [Schistocerca gregaria]|uniref:saccharopine dehydrogenase-like oxidoreductase n=1 Tax=Schistocerca gregaria TaxID=7010 RepID=UPI00211F2592|nr:saccharopine dehydrogenase-like oxidoreductase [Schistocerca gregaria]
MSNTQKEYDLIIYGATGYSGTITAEYLARRPNVNAKWAVSGRSEDKLKALVSNLSKICNQSIDYFVVDSDHYDQVLQLALKTKVLCSFVGPYRKFGEPVVKACVEASTDYIDVTGEPPYIRDVIQKYDKMAADRQVYLLPACGIGSLVTDVAVEMLKQEFDKESKVVQASTYVRCNGKHAKSFSNGTWHTMVYSMANKDVTLPTPRTSSSERPKASKSHRASCHYYQPLSCFAIPFVEGADLMIIKLTNQKNEPTTGSPEFSYSQYILVPRFPPLWLLWTIFIMIIVMYFSKFEIVRNQLLKHSNPSGGPSKSERENCSIDIWVDGKDAAGHQKRLRIHCPGPYDSTGIACAEAALIMATDRENMKKDYGLITPASSMFDQLKHSLREYGKMTYHIEDKTK